jgi:hypothetical protein
MILIRGKNPKSCIMVAVAAFALAATISACSHKEVAGPLGGETEIFFNWLPALLVDQGPASQPAHEYCQWLDDQANYPVPAKRAELAALLDRLGNATQTYRQTGAFRPTDEPILDAIDVYIAAGRAYVNGTLAFPTSTAPALLQREEG